MSKAFTREDDDAPETKPVLRAVPVLPPGVKNLITQSGAEALRRELAQPGVTAARAAEVQRILQSAIVQPPPPKPWDEAGFGGKRTLAFSKVLLPRMWVIWSWGWFCRR